MIAYAVFLVMVIASCCCDPGARYETVRAEFPKGRIYPVPDHRYQYIVEDPAGMWWVETDNFSDTEITVKIRLRYDHFKPF